MKPHYISNWETWKELCEQNDIDPYEYVDFGIDMGGGDSISHEFIGDTPNKERVAEDWIEGEDYEDFPRKKNGRKKDKL